MKALWSETAKFQKWLAVELAVCEAYFRRGVIPKKDFETIQEKAAFKLERIAQIEAEVNHDVIAFLTSVAEEVGPASRHIHLGLTSSDVVDTGLSLQLSEASPLLLQDIDALIETLKDLALKYKDALMVGRTHGVHAEPTTFGLKVAIWYEELLRHRAHFLDASEGVRVGKLSGAVGNFANIEPALQDEVCQKLGLVSDNISNQIVQRDRHAYYVTVLALLAGSLEKIALAIRGMQITELSEVEEPFGSKQKGSSAMPHKKNPILCERLCGMARLMRSYAQVAMENVPLWHERDISHSSAERVILPDACVLADYMLQKMTWVLKHLVVHTDRMKQNLAAGQGVIFSQRVLLFLVSQGITREEAYQLVQTCAIQARERSKHLKEVLSGDFKVRKLIPAKELDALFDVSYYLHHVDTIFARIGLLAAPKETMKKEEVLYAKR